jgi:FKBP-type peptidyl-prolyl cis-trans isomerase FkpA
MQMRNILLMTVIFMTLFASCKKQDDGDEQKQLDHETIEQYALDQNLNGTFTSSGLYYEIVVPGGNNHPGLNSVVTVTYKGYYLNGDILDEGSNFTERLNNLIAGWKEGIPKIGEGGKIKLVIPRHLAYGDAILVFDVTLHYFV